MTSSAQRFLAPYQPFRIAESPFGYRKVSTQQNRIHGGRKCCTAQNHAVGTLRQSRAGLLANATSSLGGQKHVAMLTTRFWNRRGVMEAGIVLFWNSRSLPKTVIRWNFLIEPRNWHRIGGTTDKHCELDQQDRKLSQHDHCNFEVEIHLQLSWRLQQHWFM
jgi:hypothetical protein